MAICLSDALVPPRFLDHNALSGHIPSSLSFPQANTITLANNALTGHVPWASLLNSSSLDTIALSNNQLSGSLSHTLPSSLRRYVVHENTFGGGLPSFKQSPRLQILSVHRNSLVGSLELPSLQNWQAACVDISADKWQAQFGEKNILGFENSFPGGCAEVNP